MYMLHDTQPYFLGTSRRITLNTMSTTLLIKISAMPGTMLTGMDTAVCC